MTISWHTINIFKQNEDKIFTGYFSVDNDTTIIQKFYNSSNPDVDIIAHTSDDYGSEYKFINNKFTWNGTTIFSIPALDSEYNSIEWMLWYDNRGVFSPIPKNYLSYKNISNNWIDILEPFIFEFEEMQVPISNVCFVAGTPISTNQGKINIELLDAKIHTICNNKIVCITKTITLDKYLVCFEKNSLCQNVPSQKTIISKNHLIFYKGEMHKAKEFVGKFENVNKIKYNGEILYNVMLKDHNKMMVNNIVCETLHPENKIGQFYKELQNYNVIIQQQLIKKYNDYSIKNNIFSKT